MKLKVTLRERVQITGVTEIARLTGCGKTHISRVLHGYRKPGKELARKLKSICGWEPSKEVEVCE